MKMKLLTATSAAFAVAVTCVDGTYWAGNGSSIETGTGLRLVIGTRIGIYKQHPPQYLKAFSQQPTMAGNKGKLSRNAKAKNQQREAQRRRNRPPADTPSSSNAEGKKEDRQDSAVSLTGYETFLGAIGISVRSENINNLEAIERASSRSKSALAHAAQPQPPERRPRHIPWRALIYITIYLCLVLGALYVLLEYLLSNTRALAASCIPSTVFVPVTQNVTTTETVFYNTPPAGITTVLIDTITATTTVTAGIPVSEAVVSSQTRAPYTFSVVDSTTLWEGGFSPTGGAQLSVATSTVTLLPVESTAVELTTHVTLTSTSTVEKLTTITLPATTSTAYSMLSTLRTTTSTSTRYVTLSLSTMPSRSSFSGMSSAGWNATATQPTASQTQPTAVLPTMTTLTETHYYGNGNSTTSTSTHRITTTLGAIITTTLLPPLTVVTINVPGAPLSATTVTAAPVTVTYTVQSQVAAFSTSVSFSKAQNSTAVGATAATSANAESTLPTAITLSGVQPGMPPSYPTQSPSSSSAKVSNSSTGYTDGAPRSIATATSAVFGTSAGTLSEVMFSSIAASISVAGLPTRISASTAFTITSFLSDSGTTLTGLTTSNGSTSSNNMTGSSATKISSVQSTISAFLSTGTAGNSIISSSTTGGGDVTPSRSLTTTGSGFLTDGDGSEFDATPTATQPGSPSIDASLTSGSLSSRSSSSASRSSTGSNTSQSSTNAVSATLQATPAGTTSSLSMPLGLTSTSSSQRTNSTISVFATKTTQSSLSDAFPASSATSSPTRGCGEQGNFTMGFDDLPTFHPGRSAKRHDRRQSNGTSSGGNDITEQPPLDLRPYHHLTFSNGFVYAPQRVEPFVPVSQPNVAAFLANGTGMRTGQSPSDAGEIGNGPAPDDVSAFWFDAFSAFLGCDNGGPGNCIMEVTGLHWDPVTKDETPAFAQNYTLPPCPSYRNCAMTPITLPSTARNLSGLEIRAVRNGEPRMFFMDDMHMAWSNKTCEAGMLRQKTQ